MRALSLLLCEMRLKQTRRNEGRPVCVRSELTIKMSRFISRGQPFVSVLLREGASAQAPERAPPFGS
jgi:hypothetical protein